MKLGEKLLFIILLGAPLFLKPSMGHPWTESDTSSPHQQHGSFDEHKPSVAASARVRTSEGTSSSQNTPRELQGTLLADWEPCTSSSTCQSGCCTAKYSNHERLQCTPLQGGYQSDICIEKSPATELQQVAAITNSQFTQQNATCGYGRRGNGVCPDGTCCSAFGWCGTRPSMCDDDMGLISTEPTSSPGNVTWCGNGEIGNGICLDGTCCSESGWCGVTADHCSKDGHKETLLPVNGTCGYGKVGNGICPDGSCCSKFGWCSMTTDHCSGDVHNETLSPIHGTCGNGQVGNGICPDGTCCSELGWCGITPEHCQSQAPSLAPTFSSDSDREKVNQTLPTSPPTGTSSSPQDKNSPKERNLVYALVAVVTSFFVVILAKGMGIISKFSRRNRPAPAAPAVASQPERQEAAPRKERKVLYPFLESSIADDSLYTTLSRKWRTIIGSSVHVSKRSLVMLTETETSVAGFSRSGLSCCSMMSEEIPNDEQEPNTRFEDVDMDKV